MDLHRLEVFCKVVELKSFTKAADAVFLSQPTVSEHIRGLEDIVNERLIDRLGREVQPTRAGKILYKYAKKLLKLRDEALQEIESFKGNLSGHLYIGASTIPGTYILPKIVGTFKEKYPTIQTTLRIGGSRIVADQVMQGDVELGVIGARWNDPSLDWDKISSDELVLAVYPNHPFARKKQIQLDDLEKEHFLFRERNSGTQKVMVQLLEEHGFSTDRLSVVGEMGSTEAVRQAIKAEIGIAILSKRAVEEDVEAGKLKLVSIKNVSMKRPFYCVRRKKRKLSPLCAVFYEYLLNYPK